MNAAVLDAAAKVHNATCGDALATTRMKPKPDAAAMPSADADLFALVARHRRYARRHRLADEEASAAYARYEAPPAPAALMITADDHALTMVLAAAEVGDVIDADVLERGRQFLAHGRRRRSTFRDERGRRLRARLVELVNASRSWARAKKAAARQAGVTKAERRLLALKSEKFALYAAIGRTPARTLAGLAAKLSVAVPDVATFVDEFADITQIEFVFAAAALDAAALVDGAAAFGDVLASTRAALELVAP